MLKRNKDNFSDYIINRQFNRFENRLKDINFLVEDIKEGQKNHRYSNIMSALDDFDQSMLENDEERKIFIQLMAQSKLNIGLDSTLREFINLVNFFVQWDELNFIEKNYSSIKYSEKNVEKNLNQLCDEYVYLKKGIKTLIDFKISQGIEEEKLQYLFIKLNTLDEIIEENKIYNWLPPENEINYWQHQLLYGKKYINHTLEQDENLNENNIIDVNDNLEDVDRHIPNITDSIYKTKKFIKNTFNRICFK